MSYLKRGRFHNNFIYHICNKSIANYGIFQKSENKLRFISLIEYYNNTNTQISFSLLNKLKKIFLFRSLLVDQPEVIVKVYAYCIMPDHYHLLIKIIDKDKISHYINTVENSYTHFFNKKTKRKGPLWQSRFRSVRIKTEKQLQYVMRYIHLNPTSSYLVEKPELWDYSSYKEYILQPELLLNKTGITIKNLSSFREFTENYIESQRSLKKLRKMYID